MKIGSIRWLLQNFPMDTANEILYGRKMTPFPERLLLILIRERWEVFAFSPALMLAPGH